MKQKIKTSQKLIRPKRNKKGFALVTTLIISGIILIISLTIAGFMLREIKLVGRYDDSTIAFYAADSGIENGLLDIKNNSAVNTNIVYLSAQTNPKYKDAFNSGTNNAIVTLAKDETFEIDMTNNKRSNITISWDDPGNDQNNRATSTFEWTLISYEKDISNNIILKNPASSDEGQRFCVDKGFFDGGAIYKYQTNPSSCIVSSGCTKGCYSAPAVKEVSITTQNKQSGPYYKLRIKRLSEANPPTLRYTITSDADFVNPLVTLSSTGTSVNVSRKIEVVFEVNRGAANVFDYVLYSEQPIEKPAMSECKGAPIKKVDYPHCVNGICPIWECQSCPTQESCAEHYILYSDGWGAQCGWNNGRCEDYGEDTGVYCKP